MLKLMLEDKLMNVVDAYSPQVRWEESQKKGFWQKIIIIYILYII